MATIRPFRGLRYTGADDLTNVVAPPYDVISEEARAALAQKSPHNVVHVTLPEQTPQDRSKFIRYARSAACLAEWRREGVLELERSPSYYRYAQTFAVPGTGAACTRTKLIATIKVEPYANGAVLPHERTFPKHRQDRLRILEATRSHVECILGLFEDEDGTLHGLIADAPASRVADVSTDDGVRHAVDLIDDPAACAEITGAMADRKVWIADGHHRYETALEFRESLGEQDGPVAEDFMLMALCSISDPGLVLLPTHRILKRSPVDSAGMKELLTKDFRVSEAPNSELAGRIERSGSRAFGVALPCGTGLVAEFDDVDLLARQVGGEGGMTVKRLDVSILHGFVFAKLLGLSGPDFFGHTRDVQEAVKAVEDGAPAAFLMNPPTVADMRAVAACGDFMPQKSTYYYPKLLSGLVLWSLKDFAE
ncbi:MAG: DUF1015 domain-containing protein [Armatimonadetes bacterium]|nr:DUF1015 domain-containing protein [Armatimonadota bacterium]